MITLTLSLFTLYVALVTVKGVVRKLFAFCLHPLLYPVQRDVEFKAQAFRAKGVEGEEREDDHLISFDCGC